MPSSSPPASLDPTPESIGLGATRPGFYPWYVVGILTLIYTSSFIDRTIVSLLIAPIRADLHITDTQMSLVSGLSFAIFYTLLGIPIGRLADRYSRRAIIMAGVTVWSAMTMTCGLANSFGQLFLARVGVGVGESSLTPSAYSLLPDYFPRDTLARAFGVYNMGIGLGSGLALFLGGLVIHLVLHAPPVVLPFVGALHPWQVVFLIVGAPGLLLAALMLTVREPPRRDVMQTPDGGQSRSLPLSRIVRYLWSIRSAYLPLVAGYAMIGIENFGFATWIPSSFIRSYGWTAAQAGERYGLAVLLTGTTGSIVGGWLADRSMFRGNNAAYIRVAIFAGCGVLPCAVLAPLAPNGWLSLLLFAGAMFFNSWSLGTFGGSLQLLTPNQMRGQITALTLLVTSLVGFGLGPTVVAVITDRFFHHDQALRYSLSIVAAVVVPSGVLFLKWSEKPFAEAVTHRLVNLSR